MDRFTRASFSDDSEVSTPCTVMLVEDMDDVREMTTAVLENSGLYVIGAAGGRDALEWLTLHDPPCLIFLDLIMPDMNGWEFAERLGASPRWAEIPIVVVSASTEMKERPIAARSFLRKPVSLERLLDSTKHCQRHRPLAQLPHGTCSIGQTDQCR